MLDFQLLTGGAVVDVATRGRTRRKLFSRVNICVRSWLSKLTSSQFCLSEMSNTKLQTKLKMVHCSWNKHTQHCVPKHFSMRVKIEGNQMRKFPKSCGSSSLAPVPPEIGTLSIVFLDPPPKLQLTIKEKRSLVTEQSIYFCYNYTCTFLTISSYK